MNHLSQYLNIIKAQSGSLRDSVEETSASVVNIIEEKFDYKSHLTGLLLGNVQSGKTAQLLGVIAKLADKGFELFIILSTDNIYLQRQTLERTINALQTFNVYGEEDDIDFLRNKLAKPIIIILKKNTNVLKRWRNLLSSSAYCVGRPIVIIDDEADASSLNTLVNKNKISTINSHLASIKALSTGSLFIQVTATPQAILLQSNISGWKPAFVYYFKPGSEYIGGDFIYSQPKSYCIHFTQENELDEVSNPDRYIPDGLKDSLMSFLVVCANFSLQGKGTCNFLVHPSVKISAHENFSRALGEHLNLLILSITEETEQDGFKKELKEQWTDLQKSKPDIGNFDDIFEEVTKLIENEQFNIIVLNSTAARDINYQSGYNIIVGGNSLGRGVTFPALQTVYYCRKAKTPQADTFWQHARMFGYDRDKGLLRVFLPPSLFNLFAELNIANRILINQIVNNKIDSLQLIYPANVKPTRANVLDNRALNLIVGGVNLFSSNPVQDNARRLDSLLSEIDSIEKYVPVSSQLLVDILQYVGDEEGQDWNNQKFSNAVQALATKRPTSRFALILRTERDIAKGTGTLLSPTDRRISDSLEDWTVLTLYKVIGSTEKGWRGNPFYIPNIKLPDGVCFYDTIDI